MKIYEWVQDWNTAVENGIRLSTYRHLRESGVSKLKAANAAKNLTVNFNRKGDAGQIFNAMYLFFNVSVQGSTRVFQAAKNKKARHD